MRPLPDDSEPVRDVLSDTYQHHQPTHSTGQDGQDVRARWAASAAQAASRAYAAAYGREIPEDSTTRMRWRLEPRVAVTAVFILALLGLGAWWSSTSAPALPAHVEGAAELDAEVGADPAITPTSSTSHATPAPPESLIVHVSGAVARPGLVTVDDGARVADAVDQAGGVIAGADVAAVNLARLARDGEQIHIPLEGEAPAPGATSGPVNLNTADESGLETLPGVGPVLAQRIVADREAHGPFSSLEDLARVSGVGEAMVAALEDLAHT